jgi:hypothetical protein
MSAIADRRGVQVEDLTKQMEYLTHKLSTMCHEHDEIRGLLETRVVCLKSYLPLNSKEGLELLFLVSHLPNVKLNVDL